MFNLWDDGSEKILAIVGNQNEDLPLDDEVIDDQEHSSYEALEIVYRLHLFSIKQQPELHQSVTQLQAKLFNTYLQSNTAKKQSILHFFNTVKIEWINEYFL